MLFLFLLLVGHIPNESAALGGAEKRESNHIRAYCSILPLVYFAERIGGEHIMIESLVPPGVEPHTFEPTSHQMAAISRADMYFSIGLPFEEILLPKLKDSIKNLVVIDTSAGISRRRLPSTGHTDDRENHGDHENGHGHGAEDPHIWLSPTLVKLISSHILDSLITFDPGNKDSYKMNYEAFMNDIDRLKKNLTDLFDSDKGKRFLVFHPAFGYFADEFGLQQVAVEIEGKEPSAKQLARLLELLKKENVKIIYTQIQFSQQKAMIIARHLSGRIIAIDPLAEDWLQNIESMAKDIKKGIF